MKCPKCKHTQEDTVQCKSCGTIFGYYFKFIDKQKFDEAFQKYQEGEYAKALKIFHEIITTESPKDSLLIERCHHYISRINERLSNTGDTTDNKSKTLSSNSKPPKILLKKSRPVVINKIPCGGRNLKVALSFMFCVLVLITVTYLWVFPSNPNANNIFKEAEKGNAYAQFMLGQMYYSGENVKQDKDMAVKWYTKAANQGNADALYDLWQMYDTGENVTQDKDKALLFLTSAAEKGSAKGQFQMARIYFTGNGVRIDIDKALKLYADAAYGGNADAQYVLGKMYDTGNYKEQDKQKAIKWYTLAADQGFTDAKPALEQAIEQMKIAQENEQLANQILQQASFQTSSSGQSHRTSTRSELDTTREKDHYNDNKARRPEVSRQEEQRVDQQRAQQQQIVRQQEMEMQRQRAELNDNAERNRRLYRKLGINDGYSSP